MRMHQIVSVLGGLLLTVTAAQADYTYTPSPTAAYLVTNVTWTFPEIFISDSILTAQGGGLFGFNYQINDGTITSPTFYRLVGTIFVNAGDVIQWDFNETSGTKYYTKVAISKYDGSSFFESLEIKTGVCCVTPAGPAYSVDAGTWTSPVPEPSNAAFLTLGLLAVLSRAKFKRV